jgi:N-acetylmuramate 1-kinase
MYSRSSAWAAVVGGRRAMIAETIAADFLETLGLKDWACEPLSGGASFRQFFRLISPGRAVTRVLVYSPSDMGEDGYRFAQLCAKFSMSGFRVPRVFASSEDKQLILVDDVGRHTLTECFALGSCDQSSLGDRIISGLIEFQRGGFSEDASAATNQNLLTMTSFSYAAEVANFLQWYFDLKHGSKLTVTGSDIFWEEWMKVEYLLNFGQKLVVHRDFHTDNLLTTDVAHAACLPIGLVDFQDAATGSGLYDLASLSCNIRFLFSDQFVSEIKNSYFVQTYKSEDLEHFELSFLIHILRHNLRVLGVVARLHLRDGKREFLPSLHIASAHLRKVTKHPLLKGFAQWLEQHCPELMRSKR